MKHLKVTIDSGTGSLVEVSIKSAAVTATTSRRSRRGRAGQTRKAAAKHFDWLTVTQAARLYAKSNVSTTMSTAKALVSRAATEKKFKSTGKSRTRLIDPVSFGDWRQATNDRKDDTENDGV